MTSKEIDKQQELHCQKEKAPSKKLKEKIHACISSFQKLGTAVNEALEQGRKEGFADKEIGKMIRDEMLQAGFERSTVAGYLPSSAKQKPRGKPGSHNKISGKNPQTEAVKDPKLDGEQIDESDILAKDDFEEQEKNRPVPYSRADVQHAAPSKSVIELESAYTEIDPEGNKYDLEQLEKYSRNTLERIIKWQHKCLQESHNEAMTWKSKYLSLVITYEKATGRDLVD
jgi:hypothetical protein